MSKEIFDNLKLVVKNNPEKFFMNVLEYDGVLTAVFDYSLTIPSNFISKYALEARGSLFHIDENHDYVATLALPFEKFFNPHEYDFADNEPLYSAISDKYNSEVKSSTDLLNLEIDSVYTKEDGSIITAYWLNNKLHCKSNSSLISEYARKAEELLDSTPTIKDQVGKLAINNWNTIFEFTSNNPKYRIVLPYDTEKLIVLAVRNNQTGEYMAHDKVIEYFGNSLVVQQHDKTIEQLLIEVDNATGIEGYIVKTKSGLRYKLKTKWYVELHKVKSHLFASPRNIWEAFLNEQLDDCYDTFSDDEHSKELLDKYVTKCNNFYTNIVHNGLEIYNSHKHLDNIAFFDYIKKSRSSDTVDGLSKHLATRMFISNGNKAESLAALKNRLLMQKVISTLGIAGWVVC